MTATPALSNDIFGKYQKKISDAFYLDHKESEYILTELKAFALEILNIDHDRWGLDAVIGDDLSSPRFIDNSDPGDEHA